MQMLQHRPLSWGLLFPFLCESIVPLMSLCTVNVSLFTCSRHMHPLCASYICVCVTPMCSIPPLMFRCGYVLRTTSSWETMTLTSSVMTATWASCSVTLPSQPTGRPAPGGMQPEGRAGAPMANGAAAPQRRRWSVNWTPVSRSCWAVAHAWFSPSRITSDPPFLLPPWPDPQTASPSALSASCRQSVHPFGDKTEWRYGSRQEGRVQGSRPGSTAQGAFHPHYRARDMCPLARQAMNSPCFYTVIQFYYFLILLHKQAGNLYAGCNDMWDSVCTLEHVTVCMFSWSRKEAGKLKIA